MDLWAWLRSLGLERYEAVFRDNEIDADVLHDLTDNHLREMGVALGASSQAPESHCCAVSAC